MTSKKRAISHDSDDKHQTKMTRISESASPDIQLSQPECRFDVEVIFPSTSKAECNDWKPPRTWEQICKEARIQSEEADVTNANTTNEIKLSKS
jgi:hypothetical protein